MKNFHFYLFIISTFCALFCIVYHEYFWAAINGLSAYINYQISNDWVGE